MKKLISFMGEVTMLKLGLSLFGAVFLVMALMGSSVACDKEDLRKLLATKNCKGCKLEGCNLEGANLESAWLQGASLEGANLSKANLEGVLLARADLSEADLSKAVIISADLNGAILRGANLEGAFLEGAYLQMTGTDFTAAIWVNGARCKPGSIGKCIWR